MMRLKFRIFLAALGAIVLALPALASEKLMRPGKWEVTAKMEIPGLPMTPRPYTTTICIKPEDVKDPETMIKESQARRGENDCKIKNYEIDGQKVTWSMVCSGAHPATMNGEMIYKGDSYEGTFHFDNTGAKEGQPRSMTTHVSGKRVGDCP
jgi:hypothetical protein